MVLKFPAPRLVVRSLSHVKKKCLWDNYATACPLFLSWTHIAVAFPRGVCTPRGHLGDMARKKEARESDTGRMLGKHFMEQRVGA